ncbi:MAG TPA: response regulator transcription factor [Vicinamibacterales bacterium]|nr:response regulator transcription factor [Vicinamibacterales bacterium]
MSISVLLADDHLVVRRGLRAVLEGEADLKIVGEIADGAEVVHTTEALKPDVLILDLMLPNLGGLQILRELRKLQLPTRVVVLSMHSSEAYVTEALGLGALGYVIKDSGADDLIRAVRQVAAGRSFLSPPLSESLLEAYNQRLQATSRDPYETLTTREREVLLLAAQGHTSAEIAAQLAISPRTAESHRSNLMQKLGLRSQSDLIRFALRRRILDLYT